MHNMTGQQYFEAIVGTLKAAKKRKFITFKGQILLKGAHDDVPITLLVDNDVNDNAQEEVQEQNDVQEAAPAADDNNGNDVVEPAANQ